MTASRGLAAAAAIALVVAAAGCGFGPGEPSRGEASLTVTRDYGSERLLEAEEEDPPGSETVMRFLDREAEITTRYGGGFVQSIDGIEGGTEGGRRLDWFFYVNGIESPQGAAEVEVRGGDRIWWDYRDWTAAMRVPAVVGSFPQPFVGGGEEAARVGCLTRRAVCDRVSARLEQAGAPATAEAGVPEPGGDAPRVLVGPWEEVRADPAARAIEEGPATSGVFADFERRGGGYELEALDETGAVADRAQATGLIAAVRRGESPPTWVVTGAAGEDVAPAAELLDPGTLHDRYALAVDASGSPLPLPGVE